MRSPIIAFSIMAAATVSPTLVSAFPNGNVVTHPRVTEVKPPGSLNSNPLQLRQLGDPAGGLLGGISGVPGGRPNDVSNDLPGGLPNGLPGGLPNGLPGGLPNGVPGGAPNGVPNGVSNDVPNGVPNGVSKDVPNGIPNGVLPGGASPNAPGAGTSNTPGEPAQPANPYNGGRVNDDPSNTNGQTDSSNPNETGRRTAHHGSQAEIQNVVS